METLSTTAFFERETKIVHQKFREVFAIRLHVTNAAHIEDKFL